jgi:hypothetical protein
MISSVEDVLSSGGGREEQRWWVAVGFVEE